MRQLLTFALLWAPVASAEPAINAAPVARLIDAMNLGELSAMDLRKLTPLIQRHGMPATEVDCVRSWKAEDFAPVLAKMAAELLTPEEIEEAIRFYESPVGRKYVDLKEVQSAQALGVPSGKAMPVFSGEEIAAVENFGNKPVYRKLAPLGGKSIHEMLKGIPDRCEKRA